MSEDYIKKQMTRMDGEYIFNYFVLARTETIKWVMTVANSLKFYGLKYSWFVGTKESGAELDPSCCICCRDVKVAFFSPPISNSMKTYADKHGLSMEPAIDAAFYFSLATKSLRAVKKMKDEGSWPAIHFNCSRQGNNDPIVRDIDLVATMKDVKGEDQLYGPITIEENGINYMGFNLDVIIYEIMFGTTLRRNSVGSFAAGTPGSMHFNQGMEEALGEFANTTVFKIVIVVQPPYIDKVPRRLCTGPFQEYGGRPLPGAKCVKYNNRTCHYEPGRWGRSYCYTDEQGTNWGAPCKNCTFSGDGGLCTGKFSEPRPLPETKCVEFENKTCHYEEGRWGKSYCYTDDKGENWGAPCNECKEKYEGYCIDLMNMLTDIMDFKYELYEAPDNAYGMIDANGEWNGMVRELMEKRADIGLGAFSVMAERENVIDFTIPYYDLVGLALMMKIPKEVTNLFKFMEVLTNNVWWSVLAVYFVTAFIMWGLAWASPDSLQNNKDQYISDEESRLFYLKECLWFCMCSLTPQGGGETPKNISGRIIAAVWWMFGFIVIASYTANLSAFLTVSRLFTPIESLDQLYDQYKIKYSPLNNSAAAMYFERNAHIEDVFFDAWKNLSLDYSMPKEEKAKLAIWDYPVGNKYTRMWETMIAAGLPQTFEEAMARVRTSPDAKSGYVYIGDATDIKYAEMTTCDLRFVGEEFSKKPYALATQQDSPIKDFLSDGILYLLNERKLELLRYRWWNRNPNKVICDDSENDTGGITIFNIGGVFLILLMGIIMAIGMVTAEWYYYYKHPLEAAAKMAKIEKPKATANGKGGALKMLTVDEFEQQFFDKNGDDKQDISMVPVEKPW